MGCLQYRQDTAHRALTWVYRILKGRVTLEYIRKHSIRY